MNIYDYVDHADNDKGEENDAMTIMPKTKNRGKMDIVFRYHTITSDTEANIN